MMAADEKDDVYRALDMAMRPAYKNCRNSLISQRKHAYNAFLDAFSQDKP